ncbi:hypothetical protein RchiOBHm_Chr3g0465031 [Rosa chinensis]|uniref:Uncharacterized protein n=1 Tax=Rosa chinensis TaxID=74649 RepID=A0A2P6R9P3_ROSCH|nr:hypothetical protein RchiOBHm_Chr3g0465031 [Rosa chinensis]
MIKQGPPVLEQFLCLKQILLPITKIIVEGGTGAVEGEEGLNVQGMDEEMDPEMAHMTATTQAMAQGVEEDVDKAHVVETEMPKSDKLKLERTLVRPVALKISIIYVIDVEALTIGPAPVVQQMKR